MALLANIAVVAPTHSSIIGDGALQLAVECLRQELSDDIILQSVKLVVVLSQQPTALSTVVSSIGSYGYVMALVAHPNENISSPARVLLLSFPIGQLVSTGTRVDFSTIPPDDAAIFAKRCQQIKLYYEETSAIRDLSMLNPVNAKTVDQYIQLPREPPNTQVPRTPLSTSNTTIATPIANNAPPAAAIPSSSSSSVSSSVTSTTSKPTITEASSTLPLKHCGRSACPAIESRRAQFYECSRCRQLAYCSKTCQVSDWKNHKASCNPNRNPT